MAQGKTELQKLQARKPTVSRTAKAKVLTKMVKTVTGSVDLDREQLLDLIAEKYGLDRDKHGVVITGIPTGTFVELRWKLEHEVDPDTYCASCDDS